MKYALASISLMVLAASACEPRVAKSSNPLPPAPSTASSASEVQSPASSTSSTTSEPEAATSAAPEVASAAEDAGSPPEPEAVEQPPAPPAEPPLFDEDGTLLPQTEEKPTADTPIYSHHVGLLFEAIIKDDPEIARPFFFPVKAYEKVKAIQKPARDWKHRLWRLFARDVHAYHEKLGDNPQDAVLERIELRTSSTRWMKPHTEGNAIGYHRVTHSRIRGKKANGDPINLELTAMISWRGEWYVVHLNGFR